MIKYGIIGTGGIAKVHAEIINNLSGVCLYGAHDIVDSNLEKFCLDFKLYECDDCSACPLRNQCMKSNSKVNKKIMRNYT